MKKNRFVIEFDNNSFSLIEEARKIDQRTRTSFCRISMIERANKILGDNK